MDENEHRNFVAYEYKSISVDVDQASLYMDAYENFGWEPDEKMQSAEAFGTVNLRFRRNRKIVNKTELTRLQRHFDACMDEIKKLEESKKSAATAVSIAAGVVGTAFMAGSVFAVTANPPLIPLCILLAIPGFLGWILPFFLFRAIVHRRTEKIAPLIEAKYDEAYEVCDKGHKLIQDL